jgi:hypothetical protein
MPPLLPMPESAALPHGPLGAYPIDHGFGSERSPDCGCDGDCHPCRQGWFSLALFYGKANEPPPTKSDDFLYGIDFDGGYWFSEARRIGLNIGLFNADGSLFLTANAGLRFHLYEDHRLRIDGLIGYEFVRLEEGIQFGIPPLAFDLGTKNSINAGQIGAIVDYRFGPYFGQLIGKGAVGNNNSEINLNGFVLGENDLCYVTEFAARVGYQLGESLWGTLGYRFNWLTDVERPGRRDSTYFIHGVTIGFEKRF